MANVKQLRVNGVAYDIKDDVARDGILDLTDIVDNLDSSKADVIPIIDLT